MLAIFGSGTPIGAVVLILMVILGFALVAWLIISAKQTELALRRKGCSIKATVTDARDDRADCQTIVTYEFTDPKTGKTYRRSGVLKRNLPFPEKDDDIEVIYLTDHPRASRLRHEEGFYQLLN